MAKSGSHSLTFPADLPPSLWELSARQYTYFSPLTPLLDPHLRLSSIAQGAKVFSFVMKQKGRSTFVSLLLGSEEELVLSSPDVLGV